MTNKLKQLLVISALSLTAASCDKVDDDPIVDTPTVTASGMHIKFNNRVGDDPLALGTSQYTNESNELYTVSKFNYYISNIKFIKKDGTEYAEPESYHLIQQNVAGSEHFHVDDVPAGEYKGVSFMIGVDEARNTSGAQTGALAVENGMFWTWSTGYIMAKLEGSSSASSNPDQTFVQHVGGFKGEYSGVRTVTLDFPNTISTGNTASGDIVIKADLKKWFGPNTVTIANNSNIMTPGEVSKKIADNYAGMFSIQNVTTVIE